ncbi:DNA polymerase III subunit chi [compost metagenome]
MRFLVDGAELSDLAGYDRVVVMFDAADAEAVAKARAAWKSAAGEHEATYWRQDDNGRWTKQA